MRAPCCRPPLRGVVLAGAIAALATAAAPAGAVPPLRVGSLKLERCDGGRVGFCGSLRRALDPARPTGRQIPIALRWLPASGGRSRGPALVAIEGGPGFPSGGSIVEYRGMYGPLLRDRDLLLVDNRGTGGSGLIDCRPLQAFGGRASGAPFAARVGRCARQIEARWGAGSSDLFATAYAAADLEAVLRALRLTSIDLYGDSYGTYFVQSFIARYPGRLHSVVLDSAYPVRDLDPWYASSGATARSALDAVCARDAGCAALAPGSASARLAALLDVVRRAPLRGATRDADGSRARAAVTPRTLADLVQDAASDPVIYRELDASVRAALGGDPAPLLRLALQSATYDHSPGPADYFSNGLYFAVACSDYPQLFSLAAPRQQRDAQLAARLADPPAGAFAPFTAAEWTMVSGYSQPYDTCLRWPTPRHDRPPLPPGDTTLPASVPVLVMGGDLDSLTPVADAVEFGPRLGALARVVTLRNATHVSSEGYTYLADSSNCARRIVRAYVRAPQRVRTLDASCADAIAAVHTPGAYPATFDGVAPATVVSGADPGVVARRAAVVAAEAIADATIRHYYAGTGSGPGLRGGSFTAGGGATQRLRLSAIRFVGDATVSGTGTWQPATGAVRARLTVGPPGGGPIRIRLSWSQRTPLARAVIGATTLTLPAP